MQEITNRFITTDQTINCGQCCYDILLLLDGELRRIAPNYKIVEVGKKNGILNYVVTNISDLSDEDREKVFFTIHDTQFLSARICEVCGKSGFEGSINGDWGVRCKRCAEPNWKDHEKQIKKYGL